MSSNNPLIYTFPRDGDSSAEPTGKDPSSRASGDNSLLPANPLFPTSVSSLLMNLGTEDSVVPELVLIISDPLQIWFDEEHLVETTDRRASVGKYYLHTVGEVRLTRVESIDSRPVRDKKVPKRAQQEIEDPNDRVRVKVCYELSSDTGPYVGDSGGPRFLYEDDGSITTDSPPIPFVRAGDAPRQLVADPGPNRTLQEFK